MPFCMRRIANSQGGPGVCDWMGKRGRAQYAAAGPRRKGVERVNRESLPIQNGHENNQRIARPHGNRLASASWATNQLHMVVGQ